MGVKRLDLRIGEEQNSRGANQHWSYIRVRVTHTRTCRVWKYLKLTNGSDILQCYVLGFEWYS